MSSEINGLKMSLNIVKIKMGLFLGVIVSLCGIFIQLLVPIFLYNPWLNGLILVSFGCGAWLPFWQIQKLERDQQFFICYNSGRDLGDFERATLLTPFLTDFYGEPKKIFSQDEIQMMSSSVDRRLHERHMVNRYLVGVLVLFGLLGTFWGLTRTVSSIATTMKGMSIQGMAAQDSFNQLRAGIQSPLSGMGIAFSSSIFGLVSSLILGFLDLLQNGAEKDFYNFLEEKLFNKSRKSVSVVESSNGPAYVLALLEQTAESINSLENRLVQTEEYRSNSMKMTQKTLEVLATCAGQIQENQNLFKKLTEVNKGMMNGFQAMSESMCDAAQALTQTKDVQSIRIICERICEEVIQGRQISTQEIKKEIRMVVKTLSALSEPDESLEEIMTAAG